MTTQQQELSLKKRNIAVLILLSFVTLGIYTIIWTYRLSTETRMAMLQAKLHCSESENEVIVLSILSLGACWCYVLGERIAALGRIADGDEKEFPWGPVHLALYLSLWFPVSLILLQMEVNRLSESIRLQEYINAKADMRSCDS